ncbi:MAG: WecB/TagA/CpsF family glycosyltransferase [Fretibacterium sp.]|nr:WecB/TagA/CpsF family glycosyltransferase [Fretibacterium sp.]
MPGYAAMIMGCSIAALICIFVQFCVKRIVPFQQYSYFRDLLLAGSWLLLSIWFGSMPARVLMGGALLAGVVGMAERVSQTQTPGWGMGCLIIAALCAFLGPAIQFIRFPDGEYIYLTPAVSFILTTFWFFIFPLLFRYLDSVPGLVGHVLAVTFALMLMACLLMGGLSNPSDGALIGSDAFFMSFAGLVLLGAFWSRFGNAYRQAGRAMSSLWGILVAGTAVLGNSKGIVFSSVFFLSLGLFAIPMLELFLCLLGRLFKDGAPGNTNTERLYQRMIARGLEHPDAVRLVAGICALLSVSVALLQSPPVYVSWIFWGLTGICAMAVVLPLLRQQKKSAIPDDKPVLWGVPFDNVSMNYAVSRARGLLSNPLNEGAQLVATVNALGMEKSVRDEHYRHILQQASMVLADGTGLLWGMRLLGMPIQERVAGIDFAEQICRAASAEGWPVYFLGAKGDTAALCASALAARYPGLVVAGARDGYFDITDVSIPDAVVASRAKVLLVAMGLPRQEKWIAMHRERLGPLLAIGVGGAFDVFSGQLSRAPAWTQKIGMEWLYRLLQEPNRWKEDLRLASFAFRVLAAKLGVVSAHREPR